MNIDFRFIILDFWGIQDSRTKSIILWFPLFLVLAGLAYGLFKGQDPFINSIPKTVSVLIPLLALMLTGITFLTSWNSNKELREFKTERILRKKPVSLYEYMVINFSYVIVFDLMLLLSYVVAGLFSDVSFFVLGMIMNALFTFFVVHLLTVMLINVGDLFFILTNTKQ